MAYTTMAVMGQNAGLSMPVQTVQGLTLPVVYVHDTAGVASTWSYAPPTGGLTNTTAVSIAAAPGTGFRNRVSSAQLSSSNALSSTEVILRSGASTVLWRGFVPLLSQSQPLVFVPPLMGNENEAIFIAEVSSVTGVLVSVQGDVAAV